MIRKYKLLAEVLAGVLFISISFFCFGTVLYLMYKDGRLTIPMKIEKMWPDLGSKGVSVEEKVAEKKSEKKVQGEGTAEIALSSGKFVKGEPKSEEEAGKTIQPKKEDDSTDRRSSVIGEKRGVLWYNQKISQYVVTLGRSDGIRVGDIFDVYDHSKKIVGSVKIVEIFHSISYAEPLKQNQAFSNNYYNAVLR